MRRTIGRDNAQTRRRARRAAARRTELGLSPEDIRDIQELVATTPGTGEWELELQGEISEIVYAELGGKPNNGTKRDKRLKENKDGMEEQPEEAALEAVEAYQAAVRCSCGHAYSDHSGGGGTCAHEDGRGTCRCGEFAYPEPEPDVQALADAILAVRPDLAGFESEITRIARRTLLAMTAAAGDIVWGPEEGLMDLLSDVGRLLHPEDEDYFTGPWACDVSVNLDKALICDNGDYFVAGLTLDGTGEPVLADRADWIPVEAAGYVATDGDQMDAARMRAALAPDSLRAAGAVETLPEEHQPAEVLPEASDEITPPSAAANGEIPWHATFVPEGKLTEDGRSFAPGSVMLPPDEAARQLPLSLMGLIETSSEGGHDRAKVAGRIDSLYRADSNIEADGVFSNEEWGQMIARMVESKELTGLSVDIAPLDWEYVPRTQFFDESGNWIAVMNDETGEWEAAPGTASAEEESEPDSIEAWLKQAEDSVLVITKAVIGMATVCPFPAFGDASIALAASGMPRAFQSKLDMQIPREALIAAGIDCGCEETETVTVPVEVTVTPVEEAMTASAAGHAPVMPPADWFADPGFEELTPLTITDDGRVYGHAWQWDTCHISFDQCVTAPYSNTEYAYFLFGEIECEDGEKLQVGKITFDTGHAGTRLSRAEAVRHYDDTGTVAAHVQFGEDEFGGWFAGAINPDFSEEMLRVLRASAISGDWRGVDGNLELVALLAVNVGGFPVPRASLAASGDQVEPVSLTAAGIVREFSAEIRDLVSDVTTEE